MLKILLVMEEDDAETTAEKLVSGGIRFSAARVERRDELSAELKGGRLDLIIADYRLPSLNGMEALALAQKCAPDTPFVFLAGHIGEEQAVEALKRGATDYVFKESTARLISVVRRSLRESAARERLKKAEAREAYFGRMNQLVDVSLEMLSEVTLPGVLKNITAAACALTGGRYAIACYGSGKEAFSRGAVSTFDGAPLFPGDGKIPPKMEKICRELLDREISVKIAERDLRAHPDWWGLPRTHLPLRGLLGARLVDERGKGRGFIMVSDRGEGKDFTVQDEVLLIQLSAMASMGLQHIEAREDAGRRAKEAEEGKRVLKALMEYVPEGITIVDGPGSVRMMSAYGNQLLTEGSGGGGSRDREFLEGLPFFKAVRRGKVVQNQEWTICGDGGMIPILCNAGPIRDDGGRISGAIVAWRDIRDYRQAQEALQAACDEMERRVVERTAELAEVVEALQAEIAERRRTEEALRRSEERYALAVQGVNDGIWDWDFENGEIYFSPRWKSILGYDEDDIQNNPGEWKRLIHSDDYAQVVERLKQYLVGEVPLFEIECRLLNRDGSYRWVLNRGACTRNEEGKPCRMAGSITDITERKRTEEALRSSERKYRTLFEESKDVIYIMSEEGRIADINPAGPELFGCAREDLVGACMEDVCCTLENKERFRRILAEEGFVKDFQVVLKRPDGREITVYHSSFAVRDEGGKVVAYRGIIRDVTEHKRLEQQLLHAQKMESIGLLAGGVAHDFNNLLTAISGYGQIIHENLKPEDELLRSSIEQVLRGARRATELTRNLLAFSRKQIIHPKPVAINDIITGISRFLERIIGEDIEFGTELAEGTLQVMADSGQMEQVLINLAANARDAMPCGGRLSLATRKVTIDAGEAELHGLETPGNYVLLTVSDTGVGMDDKARERIFEPFFTTKETGKGTGLGLSIIYGIVKQHGGTVEVASIPGEGTIFSLYLPLVKSRTRKERPVQALIPFGGSETILVAEDDEMVRLYMKGILESAGYTIITAVNGEEALQLFFDNAEKVSLVIADVVMPRKNGRELLEAIEKEHQGMKVIFISGYTADIIHKKDILDESLDFMMKPISRNELLQKVREVLDRTETDPKGGDDAGIKRKRGGGNVIRPGTVEAAEPSTPEFHQERPKAGKDVHATKLVASFGERGERIHL